MQKEDKKDEQRVSYELPAKEDQNAQHTADYTPQTTYEQQSTSERETSDRRGFLKRTGTAVVVGLGGILFGKKVLAESIDEIVGEEEGLKKVTNGYDKISQDRGGCYPERPCGPEIHCEPNCHPNNKCHPECVPHKENNTDFKKVTSGYYNSTDGCDPKPCSPECYPTEFCFPNKCVPDCFPY